jgi:DNA replicative helicase MCM subunit Mcm2 (Cdc46/Mcm family)
MGRKKKADLKAAEGTVVVEMEQAMAVMGIINGLNAKDAKIPLTRVIEEAGKAQIDESRARQILDQLLRIGEVYYPEKEFICVVPKA